MRKNFKYLSVLAILAGIILSYSFIHVPKTKINSVVAVQKNSLRLVKKLAVDTPTADSLHYPFPDNGYDEHIFNPDKQLYLNNPDNIKSTITYDPVTKTYILEQKAGGVTYRPPTYMTEEEYRDYLFKEQVRQHWKARVHADAAANQTSKKLIPTLSVNNEYFDRIFGGSTVDIRPQGSAELTFGVNINKNKNPAIPIKQQRISNFDFGMKVQLNLIGKIGEKLKLTTNYNTEASFDWENNMKLEYNGLEDEIIKTLQAGNVNFNTNSSLIPGSQSLFGLKTTLQFGRLTTTIVASQQRGKKSEVTIQGGAQTSKFEVTADNYEANRHYFLSQYFRDHYNQYLSSLPVISSPIVITKIEVWVTNRQAQNDQNRNIVAFADLGEDSAHILDQLRDNLQGGTNNGQYAITDSAVNLPHNNANSLYSMITDTLNTTGHGIFSNRDFTQVSQTLQNIPSPSIPGEPNFQSAREYELVTRARRLQPTEYTFNNRLGYISLNQALNFDEVLSVAYQYTINNVPYQVGEFSDQFPTGDKTLYLKLLKSTQLNTRVAMWDLMMKNIYSIGAYQVNPQDFKLDILYNNIQSGVDINYIPYGDINLVPLIKVMNVDKINVNGDPQSDGLYDFIDKVTINSANGRIIFPVIEPFGNHLYTKFSQADTTAPATGKKYVFQELYDSTKIAAQQLPQKNRFKLKGTYKSSSSSEISLNAMNIPQGSVTVTAGGVPLTENQDYTVDYQLGRVKIINEGILNSGAPIKISTENNSLFSVQQKSLLATRLDYRFNKDFSIGSTIMRLNERPITQKVGFGEEPVRNTIFGLDYSYRTDAPWLTRFIDKIPGINTKEPSNIQMAGEAAKLFPGNSKAIGKNGNSYIDDFEGSISLVDLRQQGSWFLASVPQGQTDLFPEANDTGIVSGINRAKLAWYTVDQSIFYQSNSLTPGNVTPTVRSNNFMRRVYETEIFPNKQPPNGQPIILPILDLGFYPDERGPYNFDVNPYIKQGNQISYGIDVPGSLSLNRIKLANPETRWGGIMRRLETNDFQSANFEFIQFWIMDPFNDDYQSTFGVPKPLSGTGALYINLGNVSEDVLKDGRMAFENGLPGDGSNNTAVTDQTSWGYVPVVPPIVNTFNNSPSDRPFQDVGYDGLPNSTELSFYSSYLNQLNGLLAGSGAMANVNADPCADDYHFYRGDDYDGQPDANTAVRYKKYNGLEGNSPTEEQYKLLNADKYSTVATNTPNIEDINRDNTLNETESYYQYKINLTPQDVNDQNVGNNFITSVYETVDMQMEDGTTKKVKWYQFKVPITAYEKKVGTIEGFNSIRFMRMFMKGFDQPIICRVARMELVRSDWRRYLYDLKAIGDILPGDDPGTTFDIAAVNIQENGTRQPINYVLPPGINQQQNIQTTNQVLLNEQAIVLRTCNLADGDARAAYKNTDLDVRSYKKLKMFVHAEPLANNPLQNDELELFVRLGTDFTNNYYEYNIPLKLTAPGVYNNDNEDDRSIVWPSDNEVVIDLENLPGIKSARDNAGVATNELYTKTEDGGRFIRVLGNPNIATLKNIMVGIRNKDDATDLPLCGEIWINELRLTDFQQKGGWAANSRVTAKLADLGNLALSGSIMTPWFGGVEKKPSERSRDLTYQYDASSTIALNKFLPESWKVNLPMYVGYSEIKAIPLFDPSNPDVLMSSLNGNTSLSEEDKRNIRQRAEDYTKRRSINFTNVSKQKGKNKTKSHFYDIENFSVTYAYTEMWKRNLSIDHNLQKTYRGGLTYGYSFTPKNYKPFSKSKSKVLNNKWFALVKDFNFYLLPSRFGFTTDINRTFNELQNRNITASPEVQQIFFNKTFNMTRNYDLKWDLSKGIKFDFTANNDGRVLEPTGVIDTKDEKDVIRENILKGGINTGYRQTSNLNYTIPINKIPLLDFLTSTYKYTTNYNWQRRSFAADTLGNTIQNSNTHTFNAQMNMTSLYNKIPYFKKINQKTKDKAKPTTSKADTLKKDDVNILEYVARVVMSLKTASISYTNTNGTTLPGFRDSTKLMGMNYSNNFAPGLGFVFGSQQDIIEKAINNEWITQRQNLVNPYAHTSTKTLGIRANLEPLPTLKIELTGNRTYGENKGEYVQWDGTQYNRNTQTQTGNFTITTITIGSAFKDFDKKTFSSAVFDKFRVERENFARLYSAQNTASAGLNPTTGLFDGYGLNQQDVLFNAFQAAYTNKSAEKYLKKDPDKLKNSLFTKVPLPNWTVTFDGLTKVKALKKVFKQFTIRHGYKSTYSLGSFSNNVLWQNDEGDGLTNIRLSGAGSNFISQYQINGVTISEQFAPLIKFDMSFADKPKIKNLTANFEMKRDRNISLNASIPQINETRGNELIIGLGYRYPQLELKKYKIQGKPIISDLDFKVDLSYRQNATIIRRVVDGVSTPSGGTQILTLKTSINYNIGSNVQLRFFFDRLVNKPVISTSFPTATTNTGISIRFNLGA